MIEVRIRNYYDAKSVHLCEWPVDRLDALMPTVGPWGITTEAGEYRTADLAGQIVVDDTSAYFEIIVGSEDE